MLIYSPAFSFPFETINLPSNSSEHKVLTVSSIVGIESIMDSIIGYRSNEWTIVGERPFLNILYAPTSIIGPTDPQGATGPQGITGPNSISTFGYVLNTKNGTIPSGSDGIFSSNFAGNIGITHFPGTAPITVNQSGVYEINFSVYQSNNSVSQISIAINNIVQNTIADQTDHQLSATIVLSLKKGDIVTIRNTDNNALSLTASPNISAYVSIMRIA